ncbi:MAG: GNAT family N-acetyltransferase [Candidatus Altiarchaeia archaeon]
MMPHRPHIREYLPGDAPSIIRLHSQSEYAFEELDLTEEFIDYIARREDFYFCIATHEGSLIGFCGVLFYPSIGRSEIGPIAVDSKHRRADVGKELFNAAAAYLKERDIRRVTAKVKAANTAAISFFANMGFAEEGFFREYTRKKEDVIQFVKFI